MDPVTTIAGAATAVESVGLGPLALLAAPVAFIGAQEVWNEGKYLWHKYVMGDDPQTVAEEKDRKRKEELIKNEKQEKISSYKDLFQK